ncbi:hypothetical protein [Roseococcus suduntuyensis]|uniref:Uncharacterized protein n=1 Tax=Roseococcus suduntuyensis TaxID=455361 RepID=A0A840AC21_9PROT|nr:hypothetical protein [Roseococcus suduntuyensis]MBB3898637.1 hypothetical protein [Roseococcus suduntuyensis]
MTQKRRALIMLLPLALAACAGVTPPETATMPSNYLLGAGDPTRGAIFAASGTFARPGQLQGRPAAAARALANMEYITVALPQDQLMSIRLDGMTELQLLAARREWRAALGVAEAAPAQGVIDGLLAASAALSANEPGRAGAALASPAFTAGPEATLGRLAALPPLPQTARAAEMARLSLDRQIEVPRSVSSLGRHR